MKRLYKKERGKKICGVCAGLAEYLNMDVTVVRLLTVAFTLCVGAGLLCYIAAAIIMPNESDVRP